MSHIVVVGAGPGIGASVARRCTEPGDHVSLVARRESTLSPVAADLRRAGRQVSTWVADVADETTLRTTLQRIVASAGSPDLVVYNAGLIRSDLPGDLTYEEHHHAWSVNVLGAIATADVLCRVMADAGRGTYLITGGMPAPSHQLTSLSLGKVGVRALTEMLAALYTPRGIHVATVTVAGPVEPGTGFDPDLIADVYDRLRRQPRGSWERHVVFTGDEAGDAPDAVIDEATA